jgi:hypothetical protein
MTIYDEICTMPWKFAVEPFKLPGMSLCRKQVCGKLHNRLGRRTNSY